MATSQLEPGPSRSGALSGLARFFFRGRFGPLLLALLGLRALRSLIPLPEVVNDLVDLGLVVCAVWLAARVIRALRTKLLWRIRRKLIISYLLIGLVPTLLILFFFLLSGLLVFGQVSSYILSTALQQTQGAASRLAELVALEIAATAGNDQDIEQLLRERIEPLEAEYPNTTGIYLSPSERILVGNAPAFQDEPANLAPPWADAGYQGLVRLGDQLLVPGTAAAHRDEAEFRVFILIPIESAFERIRQETGLEASGVAPSGGGDAMSFDAMSPSADTPFALRWAAIVETRPWTQQPNATLGPDSATEEIILFRYFPSDVYRVLSTNTPQLGQAILLLLGALAVLFLAIEVLAALVGLLLARSITGSIHALSKGTQHVRRGDFTHRVKIRSRDQLGELAESFNVMTTSIEDLLKESAEKQRLEEELRIARTIQMSLLPKGTVEIPGISVAALCLPAAEVGGDYYDFLPLGEGRLALLIADVSGKGTSAALYMAELKGLVLSLSRIHDSPRSLLVDANRILSTNLDPRSFITMSYAVFDMNERTMIYARAGHNPLLRVSSNGHGTQVLAPEGLGLGLDRGDRFEKILGEERIPLQSGDLFLFFTDGLTEAMNSHSDLFGEERLCQLLERNRSLPLEELRERIVDEIVAFAEGEDQHDDMTMVLVRVA